MSNRQLNAVNKVLRLNLSLVDTLELIVLIGKTGHKDFSLERAQELLDTYEREGTIYPGEIHRKRVLEEALKK